MLYLTFKFIHLLGVVILVGNVTVTAVWKVFADRSGDPRVIAFGQHLVTLTDWSLTLGGILLIAIGGFGSALAADINPFGSGWLIWGQVLFVLSGLIWLFILIPAQIRQARQAREFAHGGEVPETYKRDARLWIVWGIIATLPLLGATWVMVLKPM